MNGGRTNRDKGPMKARAPPPPRFTRGNGSSCPRPLHRDACPARAVRRGERVVCPAYRRGRRPDGAGHAGEGPRRPGRSRVLAGVPSHARGRHLPRDDHGVPPASGVDQQGLQHRRDVPALSDGEPGARTDAGGRHGERVHRHSEHGAPACARVQPHEPVLAARVREPAGRHRLRAPAYGVRNGEARLPAERGRLSAPESLRCPAGGRVIGGRGVLRVGRRALRGFRAVRPRRHQHFVDCGAPSVLREARRCRGVVSAAPGRRGHHDLSPVSRRARGSDCRRRRVRHRRPGHRAADHRSHPVPSPRRPADQRYRRPDTLHRPRVPEAEPASHVPAADRRAGSTRRAERRYVDRDQVAERRPGREEVPRRQGSLQRRGQPRVEGHRLSHRRPRSARPYGLVSAAHRRRDRRAAALPHDEAVGRRVVEPGGCRLLRRPRPPDCRAASHSRSPSSPPAWASRSSH